MEIGANACIDRSAVKDTVIGNGVIIDNLVQIGHNCIIGDHTSIAGNAGLSGSSIVGKHCMLAGGVGLPGHLELCDGVTVTGMSMVTSSITKPGVYASGLSAQNGSEWRKNHARLRNLDKTIRELKAEIRICKRSFTSCNRRYCLLKKLRVLKCGQFLFQSFTGVSRQST